MVSLSNHAVSAFDRSEPSALSPEPYRASSPQSLGPSPQSLTSALRRCRQPVPARVAVADGRPVRVTTDRRGFAGGTVTHCAGPWRTSGEWWSGGSRGPAPHQLHQARWDRDEWDVSLSDGAIYRIFQDRENDGWFIDAIVD